MSLHNLQLQHIPEPAGQKLSLNTAEPRVREATVRQASDIVTPIYHSWKEALKTGGVNWLSPASSMGPPSAEFRQWHGTRLS